MITERNTTMEEQSIIELIENWGYYLLPKRHPRCPGYTGLLVAIRKEPSGKHFDPHRLYLHLFDDECIARWTITDWLTPLKDSGHVCPGRVILRDRSGKSVEFFTFGASLETASGPDEMVYSFRSPAPILALDTSLEIVPDHLASETEALMAKMRARWGLDEKGFNQRLAEIDPLQFYLAALQSILLHYEQARSLEEAFREFYQALHEEKEWFMARDLWPVNPPVLEDLLAPD
jgi:hypothetical protein